METLNQFLSSKSSAWLMAGTDSSSSSWTSTATVAALVLATTAYIASSSRSDKKKRIDPNSLPPVCPCKSIQEFLKGFWSPNGPRFILELTRQMGRDQTIFRIPNLPLGAPDLIFLADYQSARKALDDPKSLKWDQANQFFIDTTHGGMNMVTAEGHRWKHVRKSTSKAFSSPNVKLMVDVIDDIVDDWMTSVLDPAIDENTSSSSGRSEVDILEEMNKITANVIAKAALDYDLPDEERQVLLSNLQTCWVEFGQKTGTNLLRQFTVTRWAYQGIRDGRRAAKELYDFCDKLLHLYHAKPKEQQQPHKLIHMIVEDTEYQNDGERVRDMIAYVIAGFDTTANTLAFTFLELARNPQEQTNLRQALRACSSLEEARNCTALKNVVREILRLHPAAANGSVRELGNDLVFPNRKTNEDGTAAPIILPKGSIVIAAYYAIQRNDKVFPEPDAFLPQRWDNPTDDQMKSLLTFSLGRRSCQGQALANAELHEVIAKLCQNYEFGVVEEGEAQNIILYKPVGTILSAKRIEA